MKDVKKITILALGLIGGSLALALKARGFGGEIMGWGRRQSTLDKALELGVIDSASLDLASAVADADIVVIATPTLIAEQMLQQLAPLVDTRTIITDVASVKGNLLAAAERAFGAIPPNLVLGHPIAGSERSGVEAAKADLYINHRVILTPTEQTDATALACIQQMWQMSGAVVDTMPVAQHDEILAGTSHLPHVLAYALVDALNQQDANYDIFRFAAGGFRDFTRIASSDPTMWHDIALANRTALLKMIDGFSEHLRNLRQAIDSGNGSEIMATFERAKAARDRFARMLAQQNQSTTTTE